MFALYVIFIDYCLKKYFNLVKVENEKKKLIIFCSDNEIADTAVDQSQEKGYIHLFISPVLNK